MDYLSYLENEAIYVLREARAQFKNPVILFSGGKDSLCLLYLARKAFPESPFPFHVLHIDTGHNFPETLTFRDEVMKNLGANLTVKFVEETIRQGRVKDDTGPYPSRNRQQAQTLLDAIADMNIDAAIGGARRDEERARAKERIFSRRSEGRWSPEAQDPELWDLLNGDLRHNEHMRVFPLSNWTEKDVWLFLKRENIPFPSLYLSHKRKCVRRPDGTWLAHSEYLRPGKDDLIEEKEIRFRTVGDMTCTSPVFTPANSIDEIVKDIETSDLSERGTRADDKTSGHAMEERKREGYF
jgi:sulfate adenylyltransferase subunit 2